MAMKVKGENIKHYNSIQILRVLACLGVFTTHLGQFIDFKGSIRVITDFGAKGVMLFFIISGFLAMSTDIESGRRGSIRYYLKRAIRILPVYYLVILYYYMKYHITGKELGIDGYGIGWFRYFALANCWAPKANSGIWDNLGATWSVFAFVLFYVLMPVFKKLVRSFRAALIPEVMLLVISQVWLIFEFNFFTAVTCLPYFGLGIAAYYAIEEKRETLLSILVCGMAIIDILQGGNEAFIYSLLFTVILLNSLVLERSVRVSKISAIDWLDEHSYAIYLIHPIFLEIAGDFQGQLGLSINISAMFVLVSTVAVAYIVHRYFEKPLQKVMRRGILTKNLR